MVVSFLHPLSPVGSLLCFPVHLCRSEHDLLDISLLMRSKITKCQIFCLFKLKTVSRCLGWLFAIQLGIQSLRWGLHGPATRFFPPEYALAAALYTQTVNSKHYTLGASKHSTDQYKEQYIHTVSSNSQEEHINTGSHGQGLLRNTWSIKGGR